MLAGCAHDLNYNTRSLERMASWRAFLTENSDGDSPLLRFNLFLPCLAFVDRIPLRRYSSNFAAFFTPMRARRYPKSRVRCLCIVCRESSDTHRNEYFICCVREALAIAGFVAVEGLRIYMESLEHYWSSIFMLSVADFFFSYLWH